MHMIRHFHEADYSWDDVDRLIYKNDGSPFKDVTRQVLFNGMGNIPCQLRYFEVKAGGYSTLEHHEHVHLVVVFRGQGQVLLGKHIHDVKCGDVISIAPQELHQFRANKGESLGFLCLVNVDRDKVKLPTAEELKGMKQHQEIKEFFESC